MVLSRMAPKRNETWVSRGILSACECFSCRNKITHRFRGSNVRILCKNPCKYRPLKGVTESAVSKLPDVEIDIHVKKKLR